MKFHMWGEVATSKVGSFECALSRVAGSAKNGTGQGRTWKVRPSLCGIPRDGSGPSRCIVRVGYTMIWADSTEVDVGPENCGVAPSSKRFSSALSGWIMPMTWADPTEVDVGTGSCIARRFPMGLHMNKM